LILKTQTFCTRRLELWNLVKLFGNVRVSKRPLTRSPTATTLSPWERAEVSRFFALSLGEWVAMRQLTESRVWGHGSWVGGEASVVIVKGKLCGVKLATTAAFSKFRFTILFS
jgi:hypothetical protein